MKLCRTTGEEARVHITIQNTYYSVDYEMPKRIEDHIHNSHYKNTILNVVKDEDDVCGAWNMTDIKCSACHESMSVSAVESHFLTEEVYKKYVAQVLKGDKK